MCIIPYGTQQGEISFCAYNTGVGWRYIVEQMHQTSTVADWYKTHGKHAVYANPKKPVPLAPAAQPIALTIPRDGVLVPVAHRKPLPTGAPAVLRPKCPTHPSASPAQTSPVNDHPSRIVRRSASGSLQ